MENKPRRRARKPKAETTEVIAKVAAPVVDRQSELIDEKISQIISLQNGLSANERMLDELNVKIKEYSKQVVELKAENVKLRNLYTNLDLNNKRIYAQLAKVPNFIKWLFNIN